MVFHTSPEPNRNVSSLKYVIADCKNVSLFWKHRCGCKSIWIYISLSHLKEKNKTTTTTKKRWPAFSLMDLLLILTLFFWGLPPCFICHDGWCKNSNYISLISSALSLFFQSPWSRSLQTLLAMRQKWKLRKKSGRKRKFDQKPRSYVPRSVDRNLGAKLHFLYFLPIYLPARHQKAVLLFPTDCTSHWLMDHPALCRMLFCGIRILVLLPSVS